MKNFLFTCWEGGGNVTPTLEAARRLVAAGHRVRFLSEECHRADALAAGTIFIPWTRALSRPDRSPATQTFNDWDVASPQEGLLVVLRDVWCGPALVYAQDVIQELRREPADLVVTSEMLVGVMAGCESIGQRFAILSVNISLTPAPGIPPMGPGLPPARTAEEHALHAHISAASQGMFDSMLPTFNTIRATLDLPPLQHLLDQFKAASVELLATAQSFDFPAQSVPDRVRYIGPLISDPAWAQSWQSLWPATETRPLVTVGFSTTFQIIAGVMQNVIDALAPLPVRVLVTLGGAIAHDALKPADNCVIVESAPHTRIMREASLVITHGGHGTVMRALVNRVPMLVIPHGRDQNDNAVRVTERNAGLSLMPAATVEEIRAACVKLLSDPKFLASAKRLGDQVAREAQACTVVPALEQAATTACHVAA